MVAPPVGKCSCPPSTGLAATTGGRARTTASTLSAPRIVASVSKGSVPRGERRSWNPCESSRPRKDSRIPLESMTMSSSMAAETATPRIASTVRVRWRASEASASVASMGSAPEEGERGRAHEPARGEPSGDDAEDERERHGKQDDVARHDGEAQRRAIHRLIVPIDEKGRRAADDDAEKASENGDGGGLEDD